MKCSLFAIALLLMPLASAQLRMENIVYRHGDVVLEGYLACGAGEERRPGVLVIHEWRGLGEYAKRRARMLAELGYVAFAADIYGQGIYAEDNDKAAQLATIYKSDRNLLRARARAGLQVLREHRLVDPKQIAAIGYCFGGTTVLELARDGAEMAGVVSFHGGLATPQPKDSQNIRTKILVLHGADDPFVSAEEVAAFQKEMRDACVDWQMVVYGSAVHSFTNPDAGEDKSRGAAYDSCADRRSWQQMCLFFQEIFDTR